MNGVQVVAPSSFFQTSPSDSIRSQPSVKDLTTEVVSVISMEEEQVQVGIELGAECLETNKGANVASPSEVFVAHPSMGIPETSYSSSEDEDFFDASEYMGQQSPTHVKSVAEFPASSPEAISDRYTFYVVSSQCRQQIAGCGRDKTDGCKRKAGTEV